MRINSSQRGFITTILLIVVLLVILGYFGLNVRDILASPVVQDNLRWFGDFLRELWANWLRAPALWVWNTILYPLFQVILDAIRR